MASSWPSVTATLVLLAVAAWAMAALARWSVCSSTRPAGPGWRSPHPPAQRRAAAVAGRRALAGCLRRATTDPLGGPAWLAAELCAEAGRLRPDTRYSPTSPSPRSRSDRRCLAGRDRGRGRGPDWRRWPASAVRLCPPAAVGAGSSPPPRTATPPATAAAPGPVAGRVRRVSRCGRCSPPSPGRLPVDGQSWIRRHHQVTPGVRHHGRRDEGPAVVVLGAVLRRVLGWGVRGGVRMIDELLSPPRTPATAMRATPSSAAGARRREKMGTGREGERARARTRPQPAAARVLQVGSPPARSGRRRTGARRAACAAAAARRRLRHAGSVAAGYDLAITAAARCGTSGRGAPGRIGWPCACRPVEFCLALGRGGGVVAPAGRSRAVSDARCPGPGARRRRLASPPAPAPQRLPRRHHHHRQHHHRHRHGQRDRSKDGGTCDGTSGGGSLVDGQIPDGEIGPGGGTQTTNPAFPG